VNLANIQAAYYMVAATGVLIAAIFHIMNLRSNMRARAMEMIYTHVTDVVSEQGLRIYTDVMNMDWKDYEDFDKKYGLSNREIYPRVMSFFFVMEATGLLIKNKVVKPEMIYAFGGHGSIRLWEKYKDVISGWRKEWVPDLFSNAEFFIQEMQKIQTRKDPSFKVQNALGGISVPKDKLKPSRT